MLTIDAFAAAADAEAARYRILAGLQDARRAFARSHVYPHLAGLVRLRRDLADLLDGASRAARPGPAIGVDWEAGRIVHADTRPALLAVDLARWALPLVDAAVDEGRTLYEFADAHADLTTVGLVPAYRGEGFLIVLADDAPHTGDRAPVCAVRYALSALTGADGRYRSLRTSPADVALDPLAPPVVWKDALAAAHPDLRAPATFRLDSDVAFPVEETLLPLAKRKLLALVRTWGEC